MSHHVHQSRYFGSVRHERSKSIQQQPEINIPSKQKSRAKTLSGDQEQENFQSDFKLKYFHVGLFSTILEDTITKLLIFDECNIQLKIQKTLSDMVQMLAKKHLVEEPSVKSEFDEIDTKRLGCGEHSLNKLKADRTFVIKVLKDTYLNLTTERQFSHLSDYVEEAEKRRERFDFLIQEEATNKLEYRDISRQLRQLRNHIKLVTYDNNNAIELFKNSINDVALYSATRSRYVLGWERARAEQHEQIIMAMEAEPALNIATYKTKIDQEQHVHTEIELLCNIKIHEIIEKIEVCMKKYETDIENIELQIQRKKNEHECTYERRIKLEETIEKHTQKINNWVRFKEEREAARLYREKMFNSAVIIQAWWRGLLFRNQLGPYRVVKKRVTSTKTTRKVKGKK